jgi:hexokinase
LIFDSGGTNLRVGFIELLGPAGSSQADENENLHVQNGKLSRVRRLLEKSWPIGEMLKKTRGEDLFGWIGNCMVEVVSDAWEAWPGRLPDPIPMGLTFSFPMLFVWGAPFMDRISS